MAKSTEIKRLSFNNGDSAYNNLAKKQLNLGSIIPSMEPSKLSMLRNFTRASTALSLAKISYTEFINAEDSDSALAALNAIKQKINVTFSNFIMPLGNNSNSLCTNMTYVFVILSQTNKMENNQKTKVYFGELKDNYDTFFILIDSCIKRSFPNNKKCEDSIILFEEIERLEKAISDARVLTNLAISK
jgi:hypothetical protein